jgi:prepilin-type processing-associated H-X9-DG protein
VHGDAHPANILWHDGHVTALLDFEWVRLGPPDLEIEPYLRWHHRAAANKAETPAILGWLAESHPAAFSPPRLTSRLWLYQLAFTLRHILIQPPDRPASELPADHPLRILSQLIAGPGYLSQLLPETCRQ